MQHPVGNDYATITPHSPTPQTNESSPLVGVRVELHSPPLLPPPRSERAATMVKSSLVLWDYFINYSFYQPITTDSAQSGESDELPPPLPNQTTNGSGPTYAEPALSGSSTGPHPAATDRVVYEDPKVYQNQQVC